MTTARGSLKTISTALMRLARRGDVEAFRAYVRSDAFLAAFNGLDPERRRSAMRAFARAEILCEAKTPLPLAGPRRIDARRVEKVNWSNQMVAKLSDAYAQAQGDHEKAARILGITPGSARLAKGRHLRAGPSNHRPKAS